MPLVRLLLAHLPRLVGINATLHYTLAFFTSSPSSPVLLLLSLARFSRIVACRDSRFNPFCRRVTSLYSPLLPYIRKRVDGKFLGPGGTVPVSQAICSSLLEECFEIAQEIRAQDESKNVASSLKPIYDRLSEIRRELENLVILGSVYCCGKKKGWLDFFVGCCTDCGDMLGRFLLIDGACARRTCGIIVSVCRRLIK